MNGKRLLKLIKLVIFITYTIFLLVSPLINWAFLGPDVYLSDRPLLTAITISVLAGISILIVRIYREDIQAQVIASSSKETIWGDLVLYSILLIISVSLLTVIMIPLKSGGISDTLLNTTLIYLSTIFSLSIVILYRHNSIKIPDTLLVTKWTFWNYTALFGLSASTTMIYLSGLLEPTSVILILVSFAAGFAAVIMKKSASNRPISLITRR